MKPMLLVVLALLLTGCITTYRDFPKDALDKKPAAGTCETMQYNVKRFDILDSGGYGKLLEVFRTGDFCKKMVSAEAVPEKGLYLEVDTKWKPVSVPALVFGYVSISFLTLLPSWSTQEGYIVKYNLYQDGQKKETYQYDISRTVVLWAGLLPFVWVNALTASEEDAFKATAYQFSADAQAYLRAPAPLAAGKP